MKKRSSRQVDPRVTVVVILIVLAVVQWAWWKGLVYRPPAGPMRPRDLTAVMGSDGIIVGRTDLTVTTISGNLDPGDADGLGRNARFDGPTGLSIDTRGNLVVADT